MRSRDVELGTYHEQWETRMKHGNVHVDKSCARMVKNIFDNAILHTYSSFIVYLIERQFDQSS